MPHKPRSGVSTPIFETRSEAKCSEREGGDGEVEVERERGEVVREGEIFGQFGPFSTLLMDGWVLVDGWLWDEHKRFPDYARILIFISSRRRAAAGSQAYRELALFVHFDPPPLDTSITLISVYLLEE